MAKKPGLYTVFNAVARVQESPGDTRHVSRRESQILFGETFIVRDIKDGWAHGETFHDAYPGYVRMSDLRKGPAPQHVITTLMSHAYPEPSMKTKPRLTLSFMSQIALKDGKEENGFVQVYDRKNLWIPKNHLRPINDTHKDSIDIVDTAIMFLGVPYGYSGRSAWGIDCSGLVQIAQQRFGIPCPRDSDQQEKFIGNPVPAYDMRRGDFVFFPGHVGIMTDEKHILNANQRHMRVVIENLDDLIPVYGPPTSVRRLHL